MAQRLGEYELLTRIAVGGMAEVFLAVPPARLGRERVVVKRLLPQMLHAKDTVAMFLDEGKLGAMLEHPSIVAILDVGEASAESYLVMEYVDGPDLAFLHTAARSVAQPLSVAVCVHVAERAAAALDAAHLARHPDTGDKLRLVHRDVSPHNILISGRGEVKLTDFGVAKSEAQLTKTATGVIKGKVAYMAPEQISGEGIDARTDVFALGVTLYETLSGQRPFHGKNEIEIIRQILGEEPKPLSQVAPHVDVELEDIVHRMLAKKAVERIPSADHVARALQGWRQRQPAALDGARQLAEIMSTRVRGPNDPFAWEMVGSSTAGATSTPDPDATSDSTRRLRPGKEPTGGAAVVTTTKRRPPAPRGRSSEAGRSAAPGKGDASSSASARDLVLYVEDDEQNFEVARLRLSRSYELLQANNDVTACEIVRTRGSELAAVLMDIELRNSALDGVALTRLFKGQSPPGDLPSYARDLPPLAAPVFYVTAHADTFDEDRLLKSGALRVVRKPVDFAELTLALTSAHLQGVRA